MLDVAEFTLDVRKQRDDMQVGGAGLVISLVWLNMR